MTQPVRVLVVDDSEDDAELVRRELARGNLPCHLTRVDDAASLALALHDETWDVVIADYSLPGFGASAVLQHLSAHGDELPCIVLSGVAGEDRAVETMRAGARDFLSKDRLHRLAPAVLRELEESRVRRERRRAERALRESETRFRELWESALDGIYTLEPGGRVTSLNAAGATLLHLPPDRVVGRHFSEFVHPSDAARTEVRYQQVVDRSLLGGPFAFAFKGPDGSRIEVEATVQRIERDGTLVECLAIVRDLTQRRELEAQLIQSQRMEAIGRVAGGVAHDFNNLLTAIIGHARIAEARPAASAESRADLREISSAAQRAAALSRQLLAFSRRQVLQTRALDLDNVVRGIEALLRRLTGEEIEFVTDLGSGGVQVLADPSQLEQVILNLAVNARDAMPSGGRLTMATRLAERMAPGVLHSGDARAGPYVLLDVTDTGSGMTDEVRLRIFEPFFSTKAVGTGLGLSTVYGIVQQSGGGIGVTTGPGKGSTFSVYLPTMDESRPDLRPGGDDPVQ